MILPIIIVLSLINSIYAMELDPYLGNRDNSLIKIEEANISIIFPDKTTENYPRSFLERFGVIKAMLKEKFEENNQLDLSAFPNNKLNKQAFDLLYKGMGNCQYNQFSRNNENLKKIVQIADYLQVDEIVQDKIYERIIELLLNYQDSFAICEQPSAFNPFALNHNQEKEIAKKIIKSLEAKLLSFLKSRVYDGVNAMCFHPDRNQIALGGPGARVKVLDFSDNELKIILDKKVSDFPQTLNNMHYSQNGNVIAMQAQDALWLCNAKTGELIHSLSLKTYYIRSVCFSPDSKWILVAWESYNEVIKCQLINVESGQLVYSFFSKINFSTSKIRMCFNPQGTIFALRGDQDIEIWYIAENNSVTLNNDNKTINSFQFSPSGKHLIAAIDNSVNILDLTSRQILKKLCCDNVVFSVSYSADENYIIARLKDKINIWENHSYKLIDTLFLNVDFSSNFNIEGLFGFNLHETIEEWKEKIHLLKSIYHKNFDKNSLKNLSFYRLFFNKKYTKVAGWQPDGGFFLCDIETLIQLYKNYTKQQALLLAYAVNNNGIYICEHKNRNLLNLYKLWNEQTRKALSDLIIPICSKCKQQ
ncbi:MAG: hypothetical protein WDZ41_01115 [Candidatus Babeliales bacterium]